MTARRRERGQAAVLTVLFLVVLLGMAAAVLDVGSWYREDRDLQKTMDAAALAGAQALPDDPGGATALADEYSTKNGGGLDSTEITTTTIDNDTIQVTGSRHAPGFFSKIFGIDSVTVNGTAKARTGVLANAKWAAPIAVDEQHPYLQAKRWGEETTLELDKARARRLPPHQHRRSHGGTNPATLGDWIRDGYEGYMPLDWYYSDPGAKYNTNPNFKSALEDVIATGRSSSSRSTGRSTSRAPASSTRSSAGSGSSSPTSRSRARRTTRSKATSPRSSGTESTARRRRPTTSARARSRSSNRP